MIDPKPEQALEGALLCEQDGPPVDVINADGGGPFIFVCEHASRLIPRALGTLGLEPEALDSHIAWDPGALAVARALSGAFDAPLVAARFSRLVFDCNRPPQGLAGIAERSDGWEIPGNRGLDASQVAARVREVYEPFRLALSETIQARLTPRRGPPPALVTIHSFTPVFLGRRRDVQLGILHDLDARLADLLLDGARDLTGLDVRRNEPYGPWDGVTHTLREHALPNGLPNAMIEMRNDLLADPAHRETLTEWVETLLRATLAGGALRDAAQAR